MGFVNRAREQGFCEPFEPARAKTTLAGVWDQKHDAVRKAAAEKAWLHAEWDPVVTWILDDIHSSPERARI